MRPVFLIGGGRDAHGVAESHRAFVEAAGGGPIACLAVDDGEGVDAARWSAGLRSAGAGEVDVIVLSAGRPADRRDVAGAAGVYVAGGLTPLYRELLVDAGTGWLPDEVPYAGFSAGAAVAAGSAIVGGWRIGDLPVCAEEAGEDLDQVEPFDGLGLVPFAVDVHATTWGTVTRLVHAVSAGLVDAGWAIDEHTCLAVTPAGTSVTGLGCAYRVSGAGGHVAVEVVGAGGPSGDVPTRTPRRATP